MKKSTIIMAGFSIALIASLETLLNHEAMDKIYPEQRVSPPNRELIAKGMGLMIPWKLRGPDVQNPFELFEEAIIEVSLRSVDKNLGDWKKSNQ